MAKWLAVTGVSAVSAVVLLGDDLVPLVFGTGYRPVAGHLVLLALALPALGLSNVSCVLALAFDRPWVPVAEASIRLLLFWALGIPLTARLGGLGTCLALLIAAAAAGGFATVRMRAMVRYPLRGWVLAVGLGALFLPLARLRGSWVVDGALFVAFLAGYAMVLLGLRVVTVSEIAGVWRALRRRPTLASPVLPGEARA